MESLENFVIVAANQLDANFNPDGKGAIELELDEKIGQPFHQIYIWNSLRPKKPIVLNVPYRREGCIWGFNDLAIANDSLFAANSEGIYSCNLHNLKEGMRKIKDFNECCDALHITRSNKLISVYRDIVQIRPLENPDVILNPKPIFRDYHCGPKTDITSILFANEDEEREENTFSIFSTFLNNKEYAVLNRGKTYLIDTDECSLKPLIRENESKGVAKWKCGVFQYGGDFQSVPVKNQIKIFSLNDFNEVDKSCCDLCEGFDTIRVHTLEERDQNFYLREEKPLSFGKKITSIKFFDGLLKILAVGNSGWQLGDYAVNKNQAICWKPISLKNKAASKFYIFPHLEQTDDDLKIVCQTGIRERHSSYAINAFIFDRKGQISLNPKLERIEMAIDVKDEIYVASAYEKHKEICLKGGNNLCTIPEIGASRRPKFCKIYKHSFIQP